MTTLWPQIAGLFGIDGRVSPLPGERSRNVLVDGPGGRFVLKVHRPAERVAAEAETAALAAVSELERVPRVIRTLAGAALAEVTLDGEPGLARALSWLPGLPWPQAWSVQQPAPAAVLADLGRLVARVDATLAGLDVPGLGEGLHWNLVHADRLRERLPQVADPQRRRLAGVVLDRFAERIAPALAHLPLQAIHNDAGEGNVLVEFGPGGEPRIGGLIDFGDVCRAPRICGLAVACAYAMCDRPDPVAAVLPLVAGYHEITPLTPGELALLTDLIRTRLAMSVVMAGWQSAQDPGNPYLLVSQDRVWPLLEVLAAADDEWALFRFRDACGYEADPRARQVRRHLSRTPAAPVVCGRPLAQVPRYTFDWSAGTGAASWTSQRLFGRLAEVGAQVGIGRYLEDRDIYTSEAYAGADPTRRRTIHLGVDLFVPAGSAVSAALDGVVHLAHDNAAPLDYGPVVILEHRTGDGTRFFTLYGHLSRSTLTRLDVGQRVAAGEEFGTVGTREENGGWAPHLHLQVLTSLIGMGADVPGVGARDGLGVWRSISPDPNLLLGLPEGTRADPGMSTGQVAAGRAVRLSRALSLSYAQPLRIVRGEGAHLIDESGRPWIDLVNNVAHVGHCHPRVVAAAARQQELLNTNTRYLHEAVVEYAQRLTATLPDPLSVCFFVNSGSEANDLALRLARAHLRSREVVVLDHAYHGNLTSLVDVSPYKFDGPGGQGRPEHTHVVPLADPYRGRYRAAPGEPTDAVAEAYLAELEAVLDGVPVTGRGRRPAVLLAETIPGTAGQVVLADGFLAGAYQRVRAAGGICVADEVQTGFGRVGSGFWAFEEHGVVPDVVTMGKPIGNGHPLGAVVTTPEVAASFLTGMEYFNTFGGNPVSARVGLAVLDVLDDERLPAHAAAVGDRILTGLRGLADRHHLVGDVRGSGLFLGVQLVADRSARTPAGAAATAVVEAVKRRGVLLSSDGPDHDVLKIKPPLVLSEADADRVVTALDEALAEVTDRD
ncbi:MAG TPA: aminotransferase class III-fold pyridoxal phosphate-dependent enzyme [Kineosporiaceae bacterium]|nr:aminotransferase class III-fold pyridoxal phosphate-dependent enzyme [Kineosporiaceae bacterium]